MRLTKIDLQNTLCSFEKLCILNLIHYTKEFYIHLQILERKNNEIEELKILYKKKQNETDEIIRKLEKKGEI